MALFLNRRFINLLENFYILGEQWKSFSGVFKRGLVLFSLNNFSRFFLFFIYLYHIVLFLANIILRAWSGCIGGWCAVQARVSGVCECAVLAVCVSLHSRLSVWRRKKRREWKKYGGEVVVMMTSSSPPKKLAKNNSHFLLYRFFKFSTSD